MVAQALGGRSSEERGLQGEDVRVLRPQFLPDRDPRSVLLRLTHSESRLVEGELLL